MHSLIGNDIRNNEWKESNVLHVQRYIIYVQLSGLGHNNDSHTDTKFNFTLQSRHLIYSILNISKFEFVQLVS